MPYKPGLLLPWTAIFLLSCSKTSVPDAGENARPATGDVKVAVVIDIAHPGRTIPADFTGLSYETSAMTDTAFFDNANTSFVNLVRALGEGVLRIGGNSVDRTIWTDNSRTAGTPKGVVTTSDVDRLFGFAAAAGWKVMYALNLGRDSLPMAVSEAKYVHSRYADQLTCMEIGNEPDLYGRNGLRSSSYAYVDFRSEFDQFYDAILSAVPGAGFSGPANAANTDSWMVPFVHDEFNRVKLVTQHYYKMGPATDPSVTITKLLNGNSGIISQASTMRAAAQAHHLPFRISECNSVYGGGKTGVSDTFAAALWGVDYMFVLAEEGADGINFHGGNAGPYTPIAFSRGRFSARPLYYGMLFFSKAAAGSLLRTTVTDTDTLNLVCHAVRQKDGTMLVTLINKDLSANAFVSVRAGGIPIQSATLMRLSGASPDAVTGVSLGGSMVDANGSWSGNNTEYAGVGINTCTVRVPACSAVLLSLR